jgi:hypothetical protein
MNALSPKNNNTFPVRDIPENFFSAFQQSDHVDNDSCCAFKAEILV